MKNVEFLIKSFRRFNCLRRLVESIRRFYPDVPIRIADDSFEDVPETLPPDAEAVRQTSGVTWHQLDFDQGLSAGRNYLVQQSDAEIVVNLDDDFVFTYETRIENLVALLDARPELGVVTGLVRWDGVNAANYCGRFRFASEDAAGVRGFKVEPLPTGWDTAGGVRYRDTDLGFNFFAARRTVLQRARWDNQFKVTFEHLDHFLELHRQKIRVATTPDAVVGHLNDVSDPTYRAHRRSPELFQDVLLNKWAIRELPGCPITPVVDESALNVRAEIESDRTGDLPNLILLAVGHSGTTIVTRMLGKLGWNVGDVDETYCELPTINVLNDQAISSGSLDVAAARDQLSRLPRPWIVKDPRFVRTMQWWLPILDQWQPELLWLMRDLDTVKASFRRRNEGVRPDGTIVSHGSTIDQLFQQAEQVYHAWPWKKRRITYDQICEAVELFDVTRNVKSQVAVPLAEKTAEDHDPLNCLLYTNSLNMGGAEQWIVEVTNRSRHHWKILVTPDHIEDLIADQITSPILTWPGKHAVRNVTVCETYDDAVRESLDGVDVVVTIGMTLPSRLCDQRPDLGVVQGCNAFNQSLVASADCSHLAAVSEAAVAICPIGTPVIRNGIDPERLQHEGRRQARKRFGLSGQVAGHIGRLSADKNCHVLAAAMRLLPRKWTAFYCGNGYGREKVIARIQAEAADRVIVHPGVGDVGNAFVAVDVVVSTSLSEGCSLAILEAWYLGIPVVSTRVGVIPEIEREVGRMVVPLPDDPTPEDVAAAIRLAKRGEITERASRWARHHATSASMVKEWDALLSAEVFDLSEL